MLFLCCPANSRSRVSPISIIPPHQAPLVSSLRSACAEWIFSPAILGANFLKPCLRSCAILSMVWPACLFWHRLRLPLASAIELSISSQLNGASMLAWWPLAAMLWRGNLVPLVSTSFWQPSSSTPWTALVSSGSNLLISWFTFVEWSYPGLREVEQFGFALAGA